MEALAVTLNDPTSPLLGDAVAVLRARPVAKDQTNAVTQSLLRVADNAKVPETVRLDALAGVPGGLSSVRPETFLFLRSHLNTELPVATRAAAAEVLSKARLTSEQLISLTDEFKTTGPLEADRLLGAFETCSDEAVGRQLLAALKSSPVLTSLA